MEDIEEPDEETADLEFELFDPLAVCSPSTKATR
jgi:hypothetical protein